MFCGNKAAAQEEQAGGQQHAGEIENNVVGVEAAAENGLDQLDGQDQHQSGPQGVPPAPMGPGEGIEDTEGQVHQDVAQVFPGKAGQEVGDQVEHPAEPVVDAAAGLVVEEKIPEVADGRDKDGQRKQARQIADKERPPDLPGDGRGFVPGKAAKAVEEPCCQSNGEHLQEIAHVGVKEKVLKGHNKASLTELVPIIPEREENPH